MGISIEQFEGNLGPVALKIIKFLKENMNEAFSDEELIEKFGENEHDKEINVIIALYELVLYNYTNKRMIEGKIYYTINQKKQELKSDF